MRKLQLHNPTSQQIYKVVSYFRSVYHLAVGEQALNMNQSSVNMFGHVCASVHCHYGWYAVAKNRSGELEGDLDFDDGSNALAEDLGLKTGDHLTIWARRNPKIWGNQFGIRIGYHKTAFYHPTKRPEGAKTLSDIIDHWQEVGDRVKKTEEATK